MARISMIEKIARDICWGEFADHKSVGCTKAAYWKKLAAERRLEYITDASRFCWWLKRQDRKLINELMSKQDRS